MVEPARRILADRYELQTLLAAGGMGQVWRASDQLLGRPVAVKVLRSEYTGDELFLARFRAEAQHAAALSHSNIAAVYDYGEEPTIDGSGEHLAYLVMELVEGESLSNLLARSGAVSVERTLSVLRQAAAALAVAHEAGVVHRDVKPGNVLVRWDGTVKITDFGIAWSAGSVPLTQTGQVLGTASYLSPEQAAGAHATPASDVYALGMVGYECLAGRRAFDGDNSVTIALRHLRDVPDPLPDDVPTDVRTLIERATVKDPAQRYPDGAAVVAAIDEVLAGHQLPPVQRTDTQSFWLLPDAAALAGASAATGETRGPSRAAQQSRLVRVLVPLVALLVGAGLAAVLLQTLATTEPRTTASAAEMTRAAGPAPEALVLEPGDYLGRPVGAVQAQLAAMGLAVQLSAVATDAAEPDTVVDIAPLSARLEPGQTVLVSYAVAPKTVSNPSVSSSRGPADTVVQPWSQSPRTTSPATEVAPTPSATETEPTTSSTRNSTTSTRKSTTPPATTSAAPSPAGTSSPTRAEPTAEPTAEPSGDRTGDEQPTGDDGAATGSPVTSGSEGGAGSSGGPGGSAAPGSSRG